MLLILITAVLTISALYVPQPLLPVLAQEFDVSREMVAMLTAVVFIPLSLAPLVYGYILEAVSARRMLRTAMLLLGLASLAICWVDSFAWMMIWRVVQGLLIPALLTALMTYTAQKSESGHVQRAMAWYIGATIVGGFAGRALSGVVASLFHWRASFLILGLSILMVWIALARLPESGELQLVRPRLRLIREVLSRRAFRYSYLMIFCFFLVFAAVMNFLPFRLSELTAEADELRIGLAYSGYLMGLLASLNAVRIQRRLGGAERTVLIALVGFAVALLILAIPSVPFFLTGMFLFCGSMFLAHATATGTLNRLADSHKGMVNGLYVAFYYGGGAVGSVLPGYVYRSWGWSGFIMVLLIFAFAAIVLAIVVTRSFLPTPNT
ncbi:MAG: MFS transporter [Deltaproteobacteria bacterium]|jgi:YNFM family putative membrane transporter|nr:MFS transporter [Deltaproteobacteria bacterium]